MRYLFYGAGGAGTGIAEMCVRQMESEGMETSEAYNQVYLVDNRELVTKHR
jgi:malic enzyme